MFKSWQAAVLILLPNGEATLVSGSQQSHYEYPRANKDDRQVVSGPMLVFSIAAKVITLQR